MLTSRRPSSAHLADFSLNDEEHFTVMMMSLIITENKKNKNESVRHLQPKNWKMFWLTFFSKQCFIFFIVISWPFPTAAPSLDGLL